ncbi:polyhydroxyalkanoate synthesis regulator DNA-binding domain-containing protein [Methylobacterium sp. WL7]|uniref:polyhydroxyalkanoate synthesis regulator DNA-binding domain-containing protein n=1 Tax=Methylobacterium sp. WL7 TaxID=2603900 RepID=UPI0011C9F1BD|nr:polyhydroxyalkanoate synthesis regulator DNA-binding domain-containing protein [Methylobacterium sp. WL7]TXN46564.1 polyhydroxyalkanoate synthesis repressor PhaR [Methylobacterium sp. WL7]
MARKSRPRRLITRYAGVRLYDVAAKIYVTDADLKGLRADGYDVVVRDAETGQYVTETVLRPEFDA